MRDQLFLLCAPQRPSNTNRLERENPETANHAESKKVSVFAIFTLSYPPHKRRVPASPYPTLIS